MYVISAELLDRININVFILNTFMRMFEKFSALKVIHLGVNNKYSDYNQIN